MSIRRVLVAALAVTAMGLSSVRGQERIEIFDAHLHYNQEPTPFYTLDQVREVFRRNGDHRHRREQPPEQGHA